MRPAGRGAQEDLIVSSSHRHLPCGPSRDEVEAAACAVTPNSWVQTPRGLRTAGPPGRRRPAAARLLCRERDARQCLALSRRINSAAPGFGARRVAAPGRVSGGDGARARARPAKRPIPAGHASRRLPTCMRAHPPSDPPGPCGAGTSCEAPAGARRRCCAGGTHAPRPTRRRSLFLCVPLPLPPSPASPALSLILYVLSLPLPLPPHPPSVLPAPPINQPCCRRSLRTPAGAASVWARPKGILAGPVPPTESRLRSTPSASPSRGLLCRPDPRESRPSRRCASLLLRRLLPACEHSCVRATTGALLPPQWRRAIRAALSSHTRRGCRTSAGQSAGDLIQQSRNATRPPQSPPPSPQPSPPHSRDLSAVAGAPPRRIPSRRPLGDSRRGARRPAVAWRWPGAVLPPRLPRQHPPMRAHQALRRLLPRWPCPTRPVQLQGESSERPLSPRPRMLKGQPWAQQRDSGSLRSFVA